MAALRLCLALILGLMVVSAYVVAPVLFTKAISHAEAGMLAGSIFHLVNVAALFLGVAVLAFWLRMPAVGRLNWSCLALFLVVVALNEFALSPMMQALKESAGPMAALAADDPQRTQFAMYHGIAALGHLISTVCAALLVALGGRSDKSDHG
ncbi:MAG: DUF4149 domain-containing protein [Mariprofundaceae bacterium]